MTVEFALAIVVAAAFACYLVWKWQEAVVDMAVPPYQEPVKDTPVIKESLDNMDNWNAKIGDKIWYKEAAAETEPTPLNPKAAWPFPHAKP